MGLQRFHLCAGYRWLQLHGLGPAAGHHPARGGLGARARQQRLRQAHAPEELAAGQQVYAENTKDETNGGVQGVDARAVELPLSRTGARNTIDVTMRAM